MMRFLRNICLALVFYAIKTCVLCVFSEPYAVYEPVKQKTQAGTLFTYQTKYFKQKLDHFSLGNNATFQQLYLISTDHWNGSAGPIFFYTGNQNSIMSFCNTSGFIWDIAPQFGAMVIFAEHRYYGESLPYGNKTYKDATYLKYLTSEQALIDYAVLIRHIKRTTKGAHDSPVIAFGGSYGGMLATWLRLKYPNIVIGALASSAPIWSFLNTADCNGFMRSLTRTFNETSTTCVTNIRRLWSTIDTVASENGGLFYLSVIFRLCKPLNNHTDIRHLKSWIIEAMKYIGVIDYPYPTSYFQTFTAWPVKEFCKPFDVTELSGRRLIKAAAESMNYFLNSSGKTECMTIKSDDIQINGWGYQSCTEMIKPFCTDGVQDMFQPSQWNFTEVSDNCYKKYGVRPVPDWISTEFWGRNLKSASNIIFSNGMLDPWSSGGVMESQSSSVFAIVIPRGAHHLDLRSAHPNDPDDVIKARKRMVQIFRKWINEANGNAEVISAAEIIRVKIFCILVSMISNEVNRLIFSI